MKADALGLLAESRRLGERGLRRGNVACLVIMGLLAILAALVMDSGILLAWLLFAFHLAGFIALYGAFSRFQREPTEEAVWKALERARTRAGKKEPGKDA